MSYKTSKNCRICNKKNIEKIFFLKPVPIGEKYYLKKINKKNKIKKYPFSVGFCKKCKNVQTMEVVSDKHLWKDYTYFSSQTKAIILHFENISNVIAKKIKLKKNELVLDIGSNDGSLLKNFKKQGCKVLGVDPAANVVKYANSKGIKTILGKLDPEMGKFIIKKKIKPKLITAFNVFAHTPKLKEMLITIKKILSKDGHFVFEVQYLGDILEKKILGTFFHEHMHHHSINSLMNFFNLHNLNFYDVMKVNIQKGSIVGFVTNNMKIKKSKRFKNLLKIENKKKYCSVKMLIKFKNYINACNLKIKKIIGKNNFKYIAGYGAARSGPNLIMNFGLKDKIKLLIDDHYMKKNKYSAFNSLHVLPPNILRKSKIDLCIILAYLHQKKIIKKNISFIKAGLNFLSLFPKPQIINKENFKKFI